MHGFQGVNLLHETFAFRKGPYPEVDFDFSPIRNNIRSRSSPNDSDIQGGALFRIAESADLENLMGNLFDCAHAFEITHTCMCGHPTDDKRENPHTFAKSFHCSSG